MMSGNQLDERFQLIQVKLSNIDGFISEFLKNSLNVFLFLICVFEAINYLEQVWWWSLVNSLYLNSEVLLKEIWGIKIKLLFSLEKFGEFFDNIHCIKELYSVYLNALMSDVFDLLV